MNSTIKNALSALQGANYSGYFEQMDKVVPVSLQTLYEEHKGKFIAGQYPWNFYQQLEIFAKTVNDFLSTRTEQLNFVVQTENSNNKPMNFKSYYIDSLETLPKLPLNVVKSTLMTDREHYDATLNLYRQYENIFNEYANYVQKELKEELEFNKYKIQSFVETSFNFQTEIKKINEKIVELRNYLFHLNNPINEDGLYKALETLIGLKEEAKYLKLFKEFISLLDNNNPIAYDYYSQLNLDLLLREIQNAELRNNIKEFWNYVQEKYSQHLSGMGKKKAFVDSFLTEEIKKQLTVIFNFLFK